MHELTERDTWEILKEILKISTKATLSSDDSEKKRVVYCSAAKNFDAPNLKLRCKI